MNQTKLFASSIVSTIALVAVYVWHASAVEWDFPLVLAFVLHVLAIGLTCNLSFERDANIDENAEATSSLLSSLMVFPLSSTS